MRSQIKEKKNNSGTETNRTLRYLVSFLVIMGLLVVLFFCPVSLLQFCSEGHFPYPVFCCRVFSRIRLQDRMCLGFPPEPNLSWH